LLILISFAAAGCAPPAYVRAEYRYQHGLIVVLPGIEGRSVLNRDIAVGLDEGGVRSAIEIYDWTYGIPGSTVMNLVDIEHNRREAARLASRIVDYRDRFPGKPVHFIGHSGGAAVAVLALEALPPGRQIDMAILLATALSPEYDLSIALRRTRHGIQNYYSANDIGFLMLGTTVFGTADRSHGISAGAVGFRLPPDLSSASRDLYREKLRQVEWDPRLKRVGASGSHMGWASETFARDYLAPLIVRNEADARARKLAEDRANRSAMPAPQTPRQPAPAEPATRAADVPPPGAGP
jgi:pimeloyl-ACP methyl ester carboxylesterase